MGGRHAALPQLIDLQYRLQQTVEPLGGKSGDRHQGNALCLRKRAYQAVLNDPDRGLAILYGIPLVETDNQGTPLLDHLPGNPEVLLFKAFLPIEQEDHHLGKVDRPLGVGSRKPFDPVGHFGAAAQPGGIDQPEGLPLVFPIDRYGIAGDARLRPG